MRKNNSEFKFEIPIRYWPFPAQERFHRDRYQVLYRGVFAGTGSGKTFAGVFEDLSWAIYNPGSVGIICEPTNKMIKRILIDQTLQDRRFLGRPLEAHPIVHSFHKTELRLELETPDPNKISTIYFISLENPEAAEGSNIDWTHIDEARLVPKFKEAMESIQRRLRGSGRTKEERLGCWVTTTPNQVGSFMHSFFENPITKDADAKAYHWSLLDNIHARRRYKDAILRSHTGSLAKIFIEGKFAPVGDMTYDFDAQTHMLNKLPDKDFFKFIVYGVDLGWRTPTCLLAIGIDGDGRAYILEEFYQRKANIDTIIMEALKMRDRWGEGTFYCDRSAPRIIDELIQAGLDAVADKSKRGDGIREVGGRFAKAGDGRPRIYVHPSCVNWIAEVQIYDSAKKEQDHAMDATRYALANTQSDLDGEIDISFGYVPK